MAVFRKIQDVISKTVTITLPDEFEASKVEILITPIDETKNGDQSLQDLLLQAPTISSEDAQNYQRVRGWMGKWQVRGF